jgi:hypothetical protein
MEWVSLFGVERREGFDENARISDSLSSQTEKSPFSHAMDLFEGILFFSDKVEKAVNIVKGKKKVSDQKVGNETL